MNWAIVGAVVGALAGLSGGILGTYLSVRRAKSFAERRYLMAWALAFSVGIGLFLGMLFVLPESSRWAVWMVYVIGLPLAIFACNRGQMRFYRGRPSDRNSASRS